MPTGSHKGWYYIIPVGANITVISWVLFVWSSRTISNDKFFVKDDGRLYYGGRGIYCLKKERFTVSGKRHVLFQERDINRLKEDTLL